MLSGARARRFWRLTTASSDGFLPNLRADALFSVSLSLGVRTARTTAWGRKYALTTVRSWAARFHWPLSGDETEERADAAPTRSGQTTCSKPVSQPISNVRTGMPVGGRWRPRPIGHKRSVEVAVQFEYPRFRPPSLNGRFPASKLTVVLRQGGQEPPAADGPIDIPVRPEIFGKETFSPVSV